MQKRHYEWSENLAYSVGLIASDGCLLSDGRHIDLTSKDISQLKNFSKALRRNFHIGMKRNGVGKTSYRIQFSDVAYYDFLIDAGLTPAKSRSISRLNVPTQFYSDFIRGVFDGDGTTYAYFDPRWPKSFLYYTAITSASRAFLDWIVTENKQLYGIRGSSIRSCDKAFSLVYGKKDSLLLYKNMYYTPSCIFLKRKKLKLESFIRQDKNATILQQ